MPGLTGILKKQENALNIEDLLARMCKVIKYEDWYKIDTFLDESIGLGRASLGTLNPESQPMFNEDKNLCIMMEGEIYGYKDLKEELILKGHRFLVNNDPEFILHLYEEYGKEFENKLKDLNGIFLFMIYNLKNHKLIICNDRYGFEPLYWCDRGNYLLFASEIKAILQDKSFIRAVGLEAMAEFFSFGYVLGDKTLIEGIKLLPPASIFTYYNNRIEIKQYWNWNQIEKTGTMDEDEIVEKLGKLWIQAVERRMHGKKRIGLTLSGGLDSRAIVSAIDTKYYPVKAITWGIRGCDDYKIAKKVCERLGIKHHFVEMNAKKWFSGIEKTVYVTDGHYNVIHQHSWQVLNEAKKYIDVNISGVLAEMVKGDFLIKDVLANTKMNEYYDIVFKSMNRGNINTKSEENFYSKNVFNLIKNVSKKSLRKNIKETISDPQYNDYFFINNQGRRFALMGSICAQTKLENRTPFFDNDFLEFLYSMPNKLRFNSYIYDKMLLKFFPGVYEDIPWQRTGLPIGSHKITQKVRHYYVGGKSRLNRLLRRMGLPPIFKDNRDFADYNNWMRNNKELRQYIYDIILSKRALRRDYFNANFVKGIIDKHMSSKENNSQIIGLLLTFELFNRMFIDGDKL